MLHLFTDIHLNIVSSGGHIGPAGQTQNELAGKNLRQLFAGAPPEALHEVTQWCLQQPGKSHKLRLRIGIAGSCTKWSWSVCAPLHADGRAHGLIWTGTERKSKYTRSLATAAPHTASKSLSQPNAGTAAANNLLPEAQQFSEEQAYILQRFEVAALISADIIADWDIVNDRYWRNDPQPNILVHPQKARNMHERLERVHPDDRHRFITTLTEALQTGAESWQCEYRYACGAIEGCFKILTENGRILRDVQGTAVRMISIVHDLTEKRKLEAQLRQKEKEVLGAALEGQEAERKQLALELHDNVGQVLAMCKLFAEMAADAVHHEYMDKCHDQLVRAIQEIRNLSHRLSPGLLDSKGLPDAIRNLTENINATAKLAIQVDIDPGLHATELEKGVQTTAYRIIQELISNTLKHAHASKAVLSLRQEKGILRLQLNDDGTGFDPLQVVAGIGLRNIQNRAAAAGGNVLIESAPGKGASTIVALPI